MTEQPNVPSSPAGDGEETPDRILHNRPLAEMRLQNKTVVFDALAAAGVARVVVSFDGYSDSGQIERLEVGGAIDVLPATTVEIATPISGEAEPNRQSMSLADAIEKLVYDFLENSHWGWEDGDGAYGEFTFDVVDRTINLDYSERYTASVNYSHEF